MPSEDNETLKFNQFWKSDKAPFIIYPVIESLIHIFPKSRRFFLSRICIQILPCGNITSHFFKILTGTQKF